MFWKFGFNTGSSVDSLLDKEDVSLEALLDEDELLQECKAQNTRLIDHFQRVDVLQRLLGYVSGQVDSGDENGVFKYPHVASEVLCSEIWSIVETCISEQHLLLRPFWETFLERTTKDMLDNVSAASRFAKVNASFLGKKPAEMLAFIHGQQNVVERLLYHIEAQPCVELLIRIIQTDGQLGGAGTLEWLSSHKFIGRLIDLLGPEYSPDTHEVVEDLLKGIIAMATPPPGEGITTALVSNRFARELASKKNISRLTDYMLLQFGPQNETFASSASTVACATSVIIELIRKNNSDYFEPYMFHTLRNRLLQVQQEESVDQSEEGRGMLEKVMQDMVEGMGVVNLGCVLERMCEHLETIVGYLRKPRSSRGPEPTSVGMVVPLTFERLRICELVAELLHCSSMSILNRSSEYDTLYDSEGRLQGGLAALGTLANVIHPEGGEDSRTNGAEDEGEKSEAEQLPVSAREGSTTSYDDMEPNSSDEEAMEEIAMNEDSTPPPATPPPMHDIPSLDKEAKQRSILGASTSDPSMKQDEPPSLKRPRTEPMYIGEQMKACLLRIGVLSTLLDLFEEYRWNNFLHSAVYDVIHQILTGNIESGLTRELAISLFRDVRLCDRIIEMQQISDIESAKPKGVRLGYMGHLTLISEDVIATLERAPPDLLAELQPHVPESRWKEYVEGPFRETKQRDSTLLGGGKPVLAPGYRGAGGGEAAGKWRDDEASGGRSPGYSTMPTPTEDGGSGELHRPTSGRPARENTPDFGPSHSRESEGSDDAANYSHYMEREHGSFGSDDDDDNDNGWLASSSSRFQLGNPPASARKKPIRDAFDDEFDPHAAYAEKMASNPFSDDDGFGPFAGSSSSSSGHYTFAGSFQQEVDDSFGDFGDFGDFQTADSDTFAPDDGLSEGRLTPTAGSGSWTHASGSSTSSDREGSEELSPFSSPQRKDGSSDGR